MNIDWSKAPEGTTHYAFAQYPWVASWYIVKGDDIASWLDDGEDSSWGWRKIDSQDRECILPRLIPRPVAAVWTGEGLPPVGLPVEWQDGLDAEWQLVTVLAYHNGHAWMCLPGRAPFTVGNPANFRLIRTPEQIAAEERLAAINYMEIDAGMCATAFDGDPEARVWIENLIDKGWRKQVAP